MTSPIERPRAALAVTISVALLAYIGIALPFPILAPLFLDQTRPAMDMVGDLSPEVLLGVVLAAYPLGMFLGGQWLGALSDRKGRRPILIVSLIGTALGYLGSAVAITQGNYPALVLSRFLSGACEGNVAVARAIAADLHPQIDKTRSMAYLNATATAGYLIGPLLAGALSIFGYALVFYVAAAMAAAALILVLVSFRETHEGNEDFVSVLEDAGRTWRLFRDPVLRPLLLFWLLLTIGYNANYHFYPFLLVKRWGMGSPQIASFTAMLTFCMMLTNLLLISFTARRFGRVRSIMFGASGFALTLLVLPWLPTPLSLYILFALNGLFIPLSGTHLTVHISDRARIDQQGRAMGLIVSLFQLGGVIMILGGSRLAATSLSASFWSGMVATVAGVALFARSERKLARSGGTGELHAAAGLERTPAEDRA